MVVGIYPYPLSRYEKIPTCCPSLRTFSVITMESDVFLQVRWKSHLGISTVPVEWNEHEPPENALFERRKIHRKRRKSPEFHRKRGKSPRVAFRAKTDFFGELSRVSVENSSLTAEKIRKEPSAATGLQPALRFLILLESGIR